MARFNSDSAHTSHHIQRLSGSFSKFVGRPANATITLIQIPEYPTKKKEDIQSTATSLKNQTVYLKILQGNREGVFTTPKFERAINLNHYGTMAWFNSDSAHTAFPGIFNLKKNKRSPSRSTVPPRYNSLNDLDPANFINEQDSLVQKIISRLDLEDAAEFIRRTATFRPSFVTGTYPDNTQLEPSTLKPTAKTEWDQFAQKYESAAKENFSLNPPPLTKTVKRESQFTTPIMTASVLDL
ncbi:hypothetical protein TSAR_005065 [Trichomalopsis sarcophagae]|uniref:Uncharacterized protein n=1 Tax=Trichomalopsis sarcophagae TaxID=543379 RepID=A0A232EP33_9HYME|nr:hypothetical protein TSAR_005065 [Trichomalopsis sarcophagae]